MITWQGFWRGRDIKYKHELTGAILANAEVVMRRVNALLVDIGFTDRDATSGWRPAAVNAATPNAAKRSNHMRGLAVDIKDSDKKLQKLLLANPAILEKHGLWMEHPRDTPTWTHLQSVPPRSGRRIFYAK